MPRDASGPTAGQGVLARLGQFGLVHPHASRFLNVAACEAFQLFGSLAEWLGKHDQAAQARAVAAGIARAFNEQLWLDGPGHYAGWIDVTGKTHDAWYATINFMAASAGITTPAWRVIADQRSFNGISWSGFSFPAFAKPDWEGSSKGIGTGSRVTGFQALEREVLRLLELYRQPVLVEDFIRGKELTVGIVGTPPRVMGIMEVVPRTGEDPDFFYSVDIKRDWRRQVRYECPAPLPRDITRRIASDSLTLFAALGCRDMARIDFRLDARGVPYFIEANPLPGLKPGHSDFPMIARHVGIQFFNRR